MPASSSFKPDLRFRRNEAEIMDGQILNRTEMEETLRFLQRTNRFFGGTSLILKHLERFGRTWKASDKIHILDIGTGLADIPAAIALWARRKGHRVHITGIEKVEQIAVLAREHVRRFGEIEIRTEDLLDMNDGSFDYVLGSLLLHHIPEEAQVSFLEKCGRVARRGLLFSDLERSLAGYWAVKSASLILGNRVVRHDGPLSVQRSFTLPELERLARESGCSYLKARREPFFRVSLSGEKP